MDKFDIEAIVRDTIEFVREEFFETTKEEKKDLAAFLRKRLLAAVRKAEEAEASDE